MMDDYRVWRGQQGLKTTGDLCELHARNLKYLRQREISKMHTIFHLHCHTC